MKLTDRLKATIAHANERTEAIAQQMTMASLLQQIRIAELKEKGLL